MLARFEWYLDPLFSPQQLKKNVVRGGPPLIELSSSTVEAWSGIEVEFLCKDRATSCGSTKLEKIRAFVVQDHF